MQRDITENDYYEGDVQNHSIRIANFKERSKNPSEMETETVLGANNQISQGNQMSQGNNPYSMGSTMDKKSGVMMNRTMVSHDLVEMRSR